MNKYSSIYYSYYWYKWSFESSEIGHFCQFFPFLPIGHVIFDWNRQMLTEDPGAPNFFPVLGRPWGNLIPSTVKKFQKLPCMLPPSNKCFGILRKRAIDRDQSHIPKSIHLKMRVETRGITHLVIREKMTVNNSLCFAWFWLIMYIS